MAGLPPVFIWHIPTVGFRTGSPNGLFTVEGHVASGMNFGGAKLGPKAFPWGFKLVQRHGSAISLKGLLVGE